MTSELPTPLAPLRLATFLSGASALDSLRCMAGSLLSSLRLSPELAWSCGRCTCMLWSIPVSGMGRGGLLLKKTNVSLNYRCSYTKI